MLVKRSPFVILQAVVFALMLREIRGKFGANRLGGFWFVFEPFAHVTLLLIIFSMIRAPMVNGVPLILFLVNGIVPFLLFKNITLTGMQAVNANRGLFAYRQIQAFDMILARSLVESALMGVVYVLILSGLWLWGGMNVDFNNPIMWGYAIAVGLMFSFSLAIVFCVIISNFPEFSGFVRILFFPFYIISGVIFPISMVPGDYLEYLLWNPYLHIIEIVRESSIPHYHGLSQATIAYPSWVALITLFLAMATYRVFKNRLVAL